ncbi:peptide deformylase [Rhizobium leguminosarum]|uniref:peptide deformylase n=1 Tax=Rhizobium TaxID=379 RepID=UPI00102F41BD|nr:peptide deformylase [Rhizobium leguminosarum]TBF87432.1 peptide deformylase [Rhizobium leguminosarum]TBG07047.1 peptide deformylase [Rhizobium leguminosarum]TBG07803.1 peptide deformylase [Rhizobium leguminosarum]TBG30738.1 peptide deformylase [Rhizobium leguminosarum]TBG50102.1 peptide deformylase [Rhizobium leguminosarum]
MTIREIVSHPDPMLRQRSAVVEASDNTIPALVADMFDTMYASSGVGLAAVQIGVLKRVVVIDVAREGPPNPQVFINPEIEYAKGEPLPFQEGCLSLPGIMIELTRPSEVKVRYVSLTRELCEIEANGVLAICLQHEIDHLDGILITDHEAVTVPSIQD